jgi:hypothetical protein
MTFNDPKTDMLTDAKLLKLFIYCFEIESEMTLKGARCFADMLKVSEQHITNCAGAKEDSHLSMEEMAKLAKASGSVAQSRFKRYLLMTARRAGINLQ